LYPIFVKAFELLDDIVMDATVETSKLWDLASDRFQT
jgi:hypothetical protein